jgi:23S rRNA (uracil1939-C5)-methyltransferase
MSCRPICAHFGDCGGCETQHLDYAEQRRRKREYILGLLAPAAPAAAIVEDVVPMPVEPDGMPRHFRHKAAFAFAPGDARGGGLVMGHFAAGSRRVVPVHECPVHSARANRIAFSLRDRLAQAGIRAAGPRRDGVLRYLVVRTTHDDRQALAMLVVTRNDKALRAPLRAWLQSSERPESLFVSEHDRDDPFMVGDRVLRIDGPAHLRETRVGPTLLLSPGAFFQTNPDAAAALVAEVTAQVAAVGEGQRVLDLYAGSGLFALPLAMAGHSVTAVEENRQAVRDGHVNARANRVPDTRLAFAGARVEDFVRRPPAGWPDVVVLDPPRQGCPAGVLERVFRDLAPRRVLYVSCNPEAFAHELPAMLAAGYAPTRVLPVDMFPHTSHVELVATLDPVRRRRREAPGR